MSFLLCILSLGKRDKIKIPQYQKLYVFDESEGFFAHDGEIFKFMMMQEGQGFSLLKDSEKWSSLGLCTIDYDQIDPDFQIENNQVNYPNWIDNENTLYDLMPLVIYDEVFDEFEQVLRYMLEQSPIHKIMFIAQLQGTYEEVVCGTIHIDKFLSMIKEKSILFNTSYIVSQELTALHL